MSLTGDGVPADPSEFRCPVWGCRARGARWVVLHEHFALAPCAQHAGEIEADPGAWRLVSSRGDGVLRIAKSGPDEPIPNTRRERDDEGPAPSTATGV